MKNHFVLVLMLIFAFMHCVSKAQVQPQNNTQSYSSVMHADKSTRVYTSKHDTVFVKSIISEDLGLVLEMYVNSDTLSVKPFIKGAYEIVSAAEPSLPSMFLELPYGQLWTDSASQDFNKGYDWGVSLNGYHPIPEKEITKKDFKRLRKIGPIRTLSIIDPSSRDKVMEVEIAKSSNQGKETFNLKYSENLDQSVAIFLKNVAFAIISLYQPRE